jgi:hypothetical protein
VPVPTLTRRDVVRLSGAVAATAVLVACTRSDPGGDPATQPGGPQDPDRALRAEVGLAESSLSALYAALTPALAASVSSRVIALGQRHDAYRQAIDPDRLADSPAPSPTGSSSASVASTPARSASPSASSSASALAQLRAAERAAATARVQQAARAADPELARVIVLASTGEASAAELLRELSA